MKEQTFSKFGLAGIAVFSGVIYLLVFVRPFNLPELYRRPLFDLYDLSQDDPAARWRLLGGFVAQGVLYGLGWRLAHRARGRGAWAIVLVGALAFGVILLFLYPFDAADIFDNIMHGRILGVHGANPFRQPASDFKMDPFYRYVAWRYATSAYGPGWEILAGSVARLAGDGVVANVLAFKLLGGVFLATSVAVLAAVLRRAAPERALAGVVLLAWNPIVLYETLGHGHNDVAMALWVLVAAWALLHRRYTLSVLALVMGGLVKFIPALLLPAATLVALRNLPNVRARLRFLLLTGVAAAALVALAYVPFWHGKRTLDIERRRDLFTTSLPAVAHALLEPQLGEEQAASLVSQFAAGSTALFALWQGLRAGRERTWLGFARAALLILTFYLLFTCLWFQSWYAVWLVAPAALLPPGRAARLGILFGFATLTKPLIFGPLWLWIRPLPPQTWRELHLGSTVLALPWLYALLALWHTWRGRKTNLQSPIPLHFVSGTHLPPRAAPLAGQVWRAAPGIASNPQPPNALLVVAKRPAPGRTKTRLTPPLSPEQAAALYECFLRDTLDLVRQVADVQRVIAYLPSEARDYFATLAPNFEHICQQGADLGARLDNALTHYLGLGYRRVVIMNSDGPTLPVTCLVQAFEALTDGVDVVLGPCDDGGYYLIGLKRPAPRLLREVRMSTPNVVTDTLALAAEEGLRVKLLPTWYDVDDAHALDRLVAELADAPPTVAPHTRAFLRKMDKGRKTNPESSTPSPQSPTPIAVIIPALNEAGNIRRLVADVLVTVPVRVIVVDNGSTDATAAEAGAAGAQVVHEPRRGYGYACAAGVAAATDAAVLAFLDGDYSFLPSDLPAILAPILNGEADLVLGSRWRGHIAPGAMPLQQRFGNWLAARLMNRLYGLSLTDLGPYRAVRRSLLMELDMREMTFGWPTEMMVKAAKRGARIVEVPVSYYRRQAGRSKVSGTLHGTLLAAWFILGVTLRYAWRR